MPDKPKSTFYLTFDDGPHAIGTPVVLKALKTCDARATFFLCAQSNGIGKDEQYRLVKNMIEDGHAIANHGDDHLPMTSGGYRGILKKGSGQPVMSEEERKHLEADEVYGLRDIKAHVIQDFVDNQAYFENLFIRKGDKFPGFMASRLPGDGRFQREIVSALVERLKVPHWGWNVEFTPNDKMSHVDKNNWDGVGGVASTVQSSKDMRDHFIVLLHDSHWKPSIQDSLDRLVGKLSKMASLASLSSAVLDNANETFKGTATPVK